MTFLRKKLALKESVQERFNALVDELHSCSLANGFLLEKQKGSKLGLPV